MKIQNPDRHDFSNYFIVLLSIYAVNPFFSNASTEYNLVFLVIIYFIGRTRGIKLMDIKINRFIFFMYTLLLVQSILYKGFTTAAIYKPFVLLYIPYLIYNMMGISYFRYFNKVLFIFAIITTPLWLMQSISPSFDRMLKDLAETAFSIGWDVGPKSILIYTSAWGDFLYNDDLGIYRNSGIFHEPGAYSVFLNIGIATNTLITGALFNKKNILFIFCVLTTLSTAGYVTLFIIISAVLFTSRINTILRIVILTLFVLISYQTYQQESFLKAKVETQYEDQTIAANEGYGRDRAQSGRFFAFFTAAKELIENPVTGRGIIYKTSKKATGEMHEGSSYGYGFIGVFMVFGIPFGLYYMINMFKGFRRIGLVNGRGWILIWATFIGINLALLTQVFIMVNIVVVFAMIGIYEGKIIKLRPARN